jgi:hypothetical protein
MLSNTDISNAMTIKLPAELPEKKAFQPAYAAHPIAGCRCRDTKSAPR